PGWMAVLHGGRRVDLRAGLGRALLALLVLHAGTVVSAERLIDELWGENPPPTADTVVQGLVSRLRKLLDPRRARGEPSGVIETVGRGYRLAVAGDDAVDATRFSQLLEEARLTTGQRRSTVLGEALRLWRGPAL